MDLIKAFLMGSAGAALVNGIFALIMHSIQKKSVLVKAARYIMLYMIQERAMRYIAAGEVGHDDRRMLHIWHDLYHNGLGGNGDADALMDDVDALRLKV